ncbi:MAG: L-rhamnose isomerase [Spirochaetaceae bacterium]|jgi:L-rhamnose isomerase|nr:L-rhamnose isomerase [Spirochaetaceae bacterium]
MINLYDNAKERYAGFGVDTDAALAALGQVRISMQCWQGDDVRGFEGGGGLSGGISATGDYPGRARTPDELMADIEKAFSLIPGKHRLNLHANYALHESRHDRDTLDPADFKLWVDFARKNGLFLDFNPTFFSHPKAASNLTLTHPDPAIRAFWIEHGKASRRIAAHFGREQGTAALNNIWVPDGAKDIPADRYTPRERLAAALDAILAEQFDEAYIIDSIESKVFGIGLESYTAGSHEFCLSYAARRGILCLLDAGHFHPTELISDKIPTMLLFFGRLALHVSRPVRWDSDHVVLFDDELKEIAKEIVRCNALERVLIGLDFFDASINRIAAWVTGMRNMQKALLYALLLPYEKMARLQEEGRWTEIMAFFETFKFMPFAAVWDHFCANHSVLPEDRWFAEAQAYEQSVLSKRNP